MATVFVCLIPFAVGLLAGAPAAPPTDPAAAGMKLVSEGRAEDAEELLVRAVAARPSDAPAWNALGLARHSLRRWVGAADAFSRASALLPKDARIHANLGAAFLEAGDLPRARVELQAAVGLDALYAKPHLLLGRVALAAGDTKGARASLQEAVRLDPSEAMIWYQLGLVELQEQRAAEAIPPLQRCLALRPDMAAAHMNLGLALRRTGDEKGASEHLDRFRELSEAEAQLYQRRLRFSGAMRQARLSLQVGDSAGALSAATEARDLAPENPAPHLLMSQALAGLGRAAEAEEERRRAQQLSTARPAAP